MISSSALNINVDNGRPSPFLLASDAKRDLLVAIIGSKIDVGESIRDFEDFGFPLVVMEETTVT